VSKSLFFPALLSIIGASLSAVVFIWCLCSFIHGAGEELEHKGLKHIAEQIWNGDTAETVSHNSNDGAQEEKK
jgi:hypothetical protein